MKMQKTILVINGSASKKSSNSIIIKEVKELCKGSLSFTVFEGLKSLPHFDTDFTIHNVPQEVVEFRTLVEKADGVIICTPEYVFSIPSGLKNAIEWCVSTTIFSKKKMGLITAAANGVKGHEELKLIMKTLEANFIGKATLLIQGVRGKVEGDKVCHMGTKEQLKEFTESYIKLLSNEL